MGPEKIEKIQFFNAAEEINYRGGKNNMSNLN